MAWHCTTGGEKACSGSFPPTLSSQLPRPINCGFSSAFLPSPLLSSVHRPLPLDQRHGDLQRAHGASRLDSSVCL